MYVLLAKLSLNVRMGLFPVAHDIGIHRVGHPRLALGSTPSVKSNKVLSETHPIKGSIFDGTVQ